MILYVIVGTGLLFIAVGFILTENNAKTLLAGYNTMSDEERQKVDIVAFLKYFRKFHVFPGAVISYYGFNLGLSHERHGRSSFS